MITKAGITKTLARQRIKALQERLVPFLPKVTGRPLRVLDVGSGDGKFLDTIKAILPGTETVGLDTSAEALQRAKDHGHETICGDLTEVEIESGSFDAIISLHVIEHVARPDVFLKACARLLRPDGVILIETPTIDTPPFRALRSGLWGGYHAPRHWHLFGRESFARLAENAGLAVKRNESYPIGTFWVWTFHAFAVRWLPRSIADALFPPKIVVGTRLYNLGLLAATSVLDGVVKKLSGSAGGMWVVLTPRRDLSQRGCASRCGLRTRNATVRNSDSACQGLCNSYLCVLSFIRVDFGDRIA
jgi:SAM-dependent methyltransferase